MQCGWAASYYRKTLVSIGKGPDGSICLIGCVPDPIFHILRAKPVGEGWYVFGSFLATDDVQWGECEWDYLCSILDAEQKRFYRSPIDGEWPMSRVHLDHHKPTTRISFKYDGWCFDVPYECVSFDHDKKMVIVKGSQHADL